MNIKYFLLAIWICSLLYNDITAQSSGDSPYIIVFTRYNVPSDYFDGSDVFLFTPHDSISCLSEYSKNSMMPKISSNGTYVAYTLGQNSLIITNINNFNKDTLNLNCGKYIWQPNSKGIIYQDQTAIKAFNIETKTTRIISINNGMLPMSISPDGKIILCQQMQLIDSSYLYQMYLVSETTTDIKTIDGPGTEKRFGSFSNDGNYVIYSGGNNDLMDNLYSYNLISNTYTELTRSNGQDLEAVYSPDGQSVCFVSTRLQDSRGNYKLYIMNSDGSNQKMIYDKFATNIIWPKSSDYIYFVGTGGIYRIKPDGSDLTEIVEADKGYYISDFDIISLKNINSADIDIVNLPQDFQLFQNYPNPFNPETAISYSLKKEGFVKILLYDVLGKKVMDLENNNKKAGKYTLKENLTSLPSGIYFYSMYIDSKYIQSKKMVLLK